MTTATTTLIPGNETRFASLMDSSYRKVYNMAYRLTNNRSDAEDLTQETFFRAYRSFQDFEGDKPFDNWVLRILTRLFLDMLRSRRRRVSLVSYDNPIAQNSGEDSVYFDVPDRSASPEEAFVQGTFSEELQKALSTLSPEQRLLITMADIEGVPYQEIADIFGKPVGTIRSRLHRTHKQLRLKMEQSARASAQTGVSGLRLAVG
jgi:RNA polymerase sigma-70 factor, ECF subfamily